ncbi:Vacuolar protein sorting-associated protein 52 A [Diplonema papillatum]|nr:Vacuolar protein sorting-associated protein 52 A [Diplonema papillatum]
MAAAGNGAADPAASVAQDVEQRASELRRELATAERAHARADGRRATAAAAAAAAAAPADSSAAKSAANGNGGDGTQPDAAPSFLRGGDLDITNEAWEAHWAENQEDLERYIRILNEDQVLAEVVNKGTNLQKYAVEKEAALEEKEFLSVDDYVQNADRFAKLYNDITQCEEMLDSIRSVVWGFREHLGSITGDIKALQRRSAEITDRIKNREGALLHLSPILQKIDVISPEWLKAIEKTPIEAPDKAKVDKQHEADMTFLSAVRQLDEKINFLSEDPHLQNSLMQAQLYPQLIGVAGKLSGKVYSFLLAKTELLKEDSTNIVIQQQALAHRCSFAFRFLRQYNPKAAENVVEHYVDMMNKVYLKLVKKKYGEVTKPEVKLAKPEAVVPKDCFDSRKGVENDGKKILNRLSGIANRDRVALPFWDRLKTLTSLIPDGDQLVIDPCVLVDQLRTYVEDFLRLNVALINVAVHEASFNSEFFAFPATRREAILTAVFEKAFGYVKEKTAEFVSNSAGDLIGVMLLLRLSECFFTHLLPDKGESGAKDGLQATLVLSRDSSSEVKVGGGVAQRSQNRTFRPPNFIAGHLKDVQATLWEQYSEAVGVNITSVHEARAIKFAALKVKSDSIVNDPAVAPHATVKRYAELLCAMHVMNTMPMIGSRVSGATESSLIFSDTIVADLCTMRKEMTLLVSVLSKRLSARNLQLVFCINNYGYVHEQLSEARISKDVTDDVETFETLLKDQLDTLFSLEVKSDMADIMSFVEKAGTQTKAQSEEEHGKVREKTSADETVSFVNKFHDTWPKALATLCKAANRYFQRAYTRQYVLQALFTKVLNVSDSLSVIAYNVWSNPPCKSRLVAADVLKKEISTKYGMSI